ncbi:hypothetical protein M441DRAFT_354205 [Trichoderma asperellum CBS 433.97]|uniref:Uncharacterized protein n=1 Tax=Trichoderma asperellum (strain ATCC 204424 / CBS 433.97 / NBRC 101777) TaxID=1042311 RepID=A0A2T3ZIW0_TRIA4|nr:hypothetical protein M441DRAFT_354205 [Trichoderma asperellum CBS 433.97]PTB44703.1 hypothetical protein M441DRAFT_354205 [Trichoderma asperellum CBS 433.97]
MAFRENSLPPACAGSPQKQLGLTSASEPGPKISSPRRNLEPARLHTSAKIRPRARRKTCGSPSQCLGVVCVYVKNLSAFETSCRVHVCCCRRHRIHHSEMTNVQVSFHTLQQAMYLLMILRWTVMLPDQIYHHYLCYYYCATKSLMMLLPPHPPAVHIRPSSTEQSRYCRFGSSFSSLRAAKYPTSVAANAENWVYGSGFGH